ncbi:methylthioribose-1-phosphate isomerase [gamma proteobacterium HTCC5015]|nr:methylthioribose-1-phosphate isomerase [gamma proteobacterium HTCC5015]
MSDVLSRVIVWRGDALELLDQRGLPQRAERHLCHHASDVAEAIKNMVVRGAPAIGIAAAYAVVLAAQKIDWNTHRVDQWKEALEPDFARLNRARPTAVNLRWALQRMQTVEAGDARGLIDNLLQEADQIRLEEVEANAAMSAYGAALIAPNSTVITHCNTGTLATTGAGTALGVIRHAHREGKLHRVYAGETRPWLQGARLTAWELQQSGIDVRLMCDSAAASVMAREKVDWVIVGADRVTANGDAVNKIGTYSLAVLAKHHGAKVMVVAPQSTLDNNTPTGRDVPIEQRPGHEVTHWLQLSDSPTQGGHAPEGIAVENPAFDVTPRALIDVFVSETGVTHYHPESK